MQKNLVFRLIAAIVVGMTMFAQFLLPQVMSQTKEKSSLRTMQGKVELKGDKVTLLTDQDKLSWEVTNPETLKGHAGRHVQIKAHVYSGKGQIHVMEVKDDDKHPCGEGGAEGVDCPPPK